MTQPTAVLSGRQINRNGTVGRSGHTKMGHILLMHKPETNPTTRSDLGCFKALREFEYTSDEQVIKLVNVKRINLSFARAITALLSVNILRIKVENTVKNTEITVNTALR